jgi:hypothetical protein
MVSTRILRLRDIAVVFTVLFVQPADILRREWNCVQKDLSSGKLMEGHGKMTLINALGFKC